MLKLLMMARRQSCVQDDMEQSRPKTPPDTAVVRDGSDPGLQSLQGTSTQTEGIVRHFITEMDSRRRTHCVDGQLTENNSASGNLHAASSSSTSSPSDSSPAAAAADAEDDDLSYVFLLKLYFSQQA